MKILLTEGSYSGKFFYFKIGDWILESKNPLEKPLIDNLIENYGGVLDGNKNDYSVIFYEKDKAEKALPIIEGYFIALKLRNEI